MPPGYRCGAECNQVVGAGSKAGQRREVEVGELLSVQHKHADGHVDLVAVGRRAKFVVHDRTRNSVRLPLTFKAPGASPGASCPPEFTVTLEKLPVPASVPPLPTVTGLAEAPLTRQLALVDAGRTAVRA